MTSITPSIWRLISYGARWAIRPMCLTSSKHSLVVVTASLRLSKDNLFHIVRRGFCQGSWQEKDFGWIPGTAACVLLSAAFFWLLTRRTERSSSAVEVVPLVSMPGQQGQPAFSPDCKQVAFRFYGGPHPGIYTALVGGEKPLQLTDSHDDSNPSWSPDGKQIVFARYSKTQRTLYVIPAFGGSARRLYTASFPKWFHCNRIDWSPDGKSLIFTESLDDDAKARLDLLSLSNLTAQPLTFPDNQQFDCDPTFSPDGATVAFVRGSMGGWLGDLFVVRVAGGEPLRLTSGNSGGDPAWTQDGSEIVFYSHIEGGGLWRISASGGIPQRVVGAGVDAGSPSISRGRFWYIVSQVFECRRECD